MGNNIQAQGNLGKDPELSYTQNNKAMLKFSIASTVGFGDKAQTIWFSCVMWGDRAEKVASTLSKGQQIVVIGELSMNEWTDRDGNPRTTPQINVSNFWYCGKKESDGGAERSSGSRQAAPRSQGSNQQRRTAPAQGRPAPSQGQVTFDDDDIPF